MSLSVDPYEAVIRTYSAIWPRYMALGFDGLTGAEKTLFCAWQFVCEVNNGGFRQFFANPSGEFATETVPALETVSMPHAASLLRMALAAFPNEVPAKDRGLRWEEVRALPA